MAASIPSTMRASQWTTTKGGLDKTLTLNPSAPLPKTAHALPPDHTLVKVAYTTPNPIDYKLAEVLPFIFSKPAIPCLDFSGTILATTLPHLKPGELVFGKTEPPAFGALGEYVVVAKAGCVPVPNGVSLKQAACVGVAGLTSYQCLAPHVRPGDKVLINGGSGGTGTFAIQIAKALGCYVTATCSGANAELCRSLGADEVIDYRVEDVVGTLKRSGRQYDLIYDTVFAVPALYWECHHYLKASGKFITIAGTPSVGFLVEFLKLFLWPAVLGGGQRKLAFHTASSSAVDYEAIAKMMAEGKVKAVVEKEFGLERAGEAFAHLKSGRTKGKLVIEVAGE